jgi:hypothetical protein
MTRLGLFAGVLVLVAGAAGCGGGDGGSSAGAGATATSSASVEPAPMPASGGVPWPAPSNPLELTREAGLTPDIREFLDYHVHAHLDVFVNGQPVEVPGGIGIDIENPDVQQFPAAGGTTAYGGIEQCAEPCISPLHTHENDGVMHTESRSDTPNTLGQFFAEWDVPLDEGCVGGYCEKAANIEVYVDGELYDGDPADIALTDGKEIAIVIGTRPASIPDSFSGSG